MEELKMLHRARMYMDAMSKGINPINGEKASDGDTVSNERVQKCCEYVVQVFDELIEKQESKNKLPFSVTPEQAQRVFISATPVGINEIAKRINSVTDRRMNNITGAKIVSWLADNGYMDVEKISETKIKEKKKLNAKSALLGITLQSGVDRKTGEVYDQFVYNENAQKFIIMHLNDIM